MQRLEEILFCLFWGITAGMIAYTTFTVCEIKNKLDLLDLLTKINKVLENGRKDSNQP